MCTLGWLRVPAKRMLNRLCILQTDLPACPLAPRLPQDYRQKHRQAVRMLGRSAGGGGGKRQRKG